MPQFIDYIDAAIFMLPVLLALVSAPVLLLRLVR